MWWRIWKTGPNVRWELNSISGHISDAILGGHNDNMNTVEFAEPLPFTVDIYVAFISQPADKLDFTYGKPAKAMHTTVALHDTVAGGNLMLLHVSHQMR